MSDHRPLAIFDLDGTLFRSSLVIELVTELVARGYFPRKAAEDIQEDYKAWVNRRGTYENYIRAVVSAYRAHIVGCKEVDISASVRAVIEDQRDHVYRFTRDLISSLRKRSYYLVALSGSPIPIVSRFAESIGFDTYCATSYEVRNGTIIGSGEMLQKRTELESLLAAGKHTLRGSIAVGDTEGDIPILEMVDVPIAFNPNAVLAAHAKKLGWHIVIERKDVIVVPESFRLITRAEDVLKEILPMP